MVQSSMTMSYGKKIGFNSCKAAARSSYILKNTLGWTKMNQQFISIRWNPAFRKEVEYVTQRCTICLKNNAGGKTKTPVIHQWVKTQALPEIWHGYLEVLVRADGESFPKHERHSRLYGKNVCGRGMDIIWNSRLCAYNQSGCSRCTRRVSYNQKPSLLHYKKHSQRHSSYPVWDHHQPTNVIARDRWLAYFWPTPD